MARAGALLHETTVGSTPSVIFGEDERGLHANFSPESYRRILERPAWSQRLLKVHTGSRRAMPRADWRWRELDCANSSDALLMNVFCYPDVLSDVRVTSLLGVEAGLEPEFGFRPGIPLRGALKRVSATKPPRERLDRTEIDLRLGSLLVEAKLTETNFQTAPLRLLERYRDLDAVFDVRELPWKDGVVQGYQLIRGALAAFAEGASFCVLSDARRADLIETWYAVLQAVHQPGFRWRLKLLTWQELAGALPEKLQQFLAEKYGIVA